DLILKVMGTMPSPREARQFLSKFSPTTTTTTTARAAPAPSATQKKGDTDFVDTLLWPTDHLALIKLEGPFKKPDLAAIANTLVQLQRLGLMSVVMLDNQTWWQETGGLDQAAETRQRMMKDMLELVEQIEKSGGKARPVSEDIFEAPPHRRPGHDRIAQPQQLQQPHEPSDEVTIRPGLCPIQSCLKLQQIPVMIPMATTTSSHRVPVQSNEALVALAKYMGSTVQQDSVPPPSGAGQHGHGPLVPMRLVVVNTTGGIPLTRSNGIDGPTHCFVNLKDEYGAILDDLDHMDSISAPLAKSYRSDLAMIKENPKVMLATTVLRSGLDIFTFRNSLEGLDLRRLQGLLESSFGKPMDAEGFYARIQDRTKTVILAGQDYMGAAIVTREGGTLRDPTRGELGGRL
ncbi:Amino-acid acetyltransferase, mitochondrial, partial [Mortierella alpina]